MMTNKPQPQPQTQTKKTNKSPLAEIAGKFGGEFWEETQLEIERSRQQDKEANSFLNQLLTLI